ncbi:IS66 family insertion sequence element accessory protein TnpB [Microbulbifer sp. 2205BS26-8]|uniref:IS66 family insertion sequence element accessory protein TnpA n=1 Tax=Microbulbifer sp. 2205BS26-8 TaxID=3064386 RepID=UPI00273E5E40|nr:IS66 family insertion sequence element accessory protein TnpB [Microbulbifer sp. 2205BS26-8]MDP5211118.1 IS66 family insertion sequence element accessory protein TnpB [Microbulbifer sp. 2205BS26-8]
MSKRSRAEWLALFSQHHTSNLTAAAFCRQHKLCPKYFSLRKKQLQWTPPSVATESSQPAFVSARVLPATHAHIFTLRWQGIELTFPCGISPEWMAELVRELAV